MANISDNIIGVDFTHVYDPAETTKVRPFKTGTTVFGDDGKTYQYAKASGAIGASATTCLITLSGDEYVVAASGGTADNASGVALVADDHAWFILD